MATYRLRDDMMKPAPTIAVHTPDKIRVEIKKLEQEVESKLGAYSNLSERVEQWTEEADGAAFGGHEIGLELERLLQKLGELNRALDEGSTSSSIIQHHRTHLDEYSREYRHIHNKVKMATERAQLVGARRPANTESTVNIDHLFRERTSVQNSTAMANDLFAQAQSTSDRLEEQYRRLMGTSSKFQSVTSQFSGLSTVLSQIRFKKYKNSIIVWSVVAICLCFLLWWWLRS
eukprot:TRINITY_DN26597_c0_g1_i1.p1 TRINITY_DN26597_c0_g1~~TRINITY_DN26597_c0_g1_i1.p1  ORF type:complete len:232 (-),score=6.83 TRINITY_DN26597_c0_g1_i1:147-842(-)